MSSPFTYAWQNAERGCWEYWNKVFGTVEGLTAFSVRDMPRTLPEKDAFIWRFVFSGGTKQVLRPDRSTVLNGAWTMDALLEAWAADDDTAMWLGGIVEENQPVLASDVPGLERLYTTSFPSRDMDTLRLGGTDNAGQDILVVRVTIPMIAVFSNTDRRV